LLETIESGVWQEVGDSTRSLAEALAHCNYPLEKEHEAFVEEKIVDDVKCGRVLVLTQDKAVEYLEGQLHIAPYFVTLTGEKLRMIHNLSNEEKGKGKEGRGSINDRTDKEWAPTNGDGKALEKFAMQLWALRQENPEEVIYMQKIDVSGAFRQVATDTRGPVFGYKYGELVVIDLRLQFGGRRHQRGGRW
jgi:hypothetical protein